MRVERVVEIPILYTRSHSPDDHTTKGKTCAEREYLTENAEERARHRTFRLWVSDGEHVIQALLKKELHPFVSMGDVVPGAVMMLQAYKLRVADRVRTGSGPLSTRSREGGKVVFLAIEQFRTVWRPGSRFDTGGEQERGRGDGIEVGEMVVKKRVRGEDKRGVGRGCKRPRSRGNDSKPDTSDELNVQDRALPDTGGNEDIQTNPVAVEPELSGAASTIPDIGAQLAAVAGSYPEPVDRMTSANTPYPWTRTATKAVLPKPKPNSAETQVPYIVSPKKTAENQQQQRPAQTQPVVRKPRPSTLKPVTQRPLTTHPHPPQFFQPPTFVMPNTIPGTPKLYTLTSLLHPTASEPIAKRNHLVSIFAVIVSISRTTRSLPQTSLGLKRDMRIMDSTLPYRSLGILLSVFVDAENFFPEPGTVALFTGLKTHEYEGVSLNAYEKECGGREWCVTDEGRLERMGFDVAGLKGWWERRCEVVGGP